MIPQDPHHRALFGDDAVVTVPADPARRAALREAVARYAARERLLPPLGSDELAAHAALLRETLAADADEQPFLALLLGNAVWEETVAAVPFDRRLLLLPQCLSRGEACPGERDGIGLLCAGCGSCAIDELQRVAASLGYVTLVAEGTTVVRTLLAGGAIDAVVGVGCLRSLARVFPDMARHAIPGIGIPLLDEGCRTTRIDAEWVLATLRLHRARGPRALPDLQALQQVVAGWFEPAALATLPGAAATTVDREGLAWLAVGGKRWRPLLAVAVERVLRDDDDAPPGAERHVALAVECFHKASLVHDDIEDGDVERYGQPTMHRRLGTPTALNVGDFLIGEGYRLLAAAPLPDTARVRLVAAAAEGHRTLCLGQGEELALTASPNPITLATYVRLCERKTGAAFSVALELGAVAGGADEETCSCLRRFSRSLGVAYQMRDDLADPSDLDAGRPCLALAVACESVDPGVQAALADWWTQPAAPGRGTPLLTALRAAGFDERARQAVSHHLHEAERTLASLRSAGLKRLLRRLATTLVEVPV